MLKRQQKISQQFLTITHGSKFYNLYQKETPKFKMYFFHISWYGKLMILICKLREISKNSIPICRSFDSCFQRFAVREYEMFVIF